MPSGSAMSVALSDRIWQHGKEITPSETSALLNTKNGNIYLQNVQANKQAYDYTQGLIQNGSPAQRAESVANIKQGFYKGVYPTRIYFICFGKKISSKYSRNTD